jgi:hypothetical protein
MIRGIAAVALFSILVGGTARAAEGPAAKPQDKYAVGVAPQGSEKVSGKAPG